MDHRLGEAVAKHGLVPKAVIVTANGPRSTRLLGLGGIVCGPNAQAK